MSQPRSGQWALAVRRGKPTYKSHVPCIECGTTLRITKSRKCFDCYVTWQDNTYYQARIQVPGFKEQRAAAERARRAKRKAMGAMAPFERFIMSIMENTRKDKTMTKACLHKGAAKQAGRKTYTTGIACEACDTDKRYTVSGNCVECNRRANRKQSSSEAGRAANRERQARYQAKQRAKRNMAIATISLFDDI